VYRNNEEAKYAGWQVSYSGKVTPIASCMAKQDMPMINESTELRRTAMRSYSTASPAWRMRDMMQWHGPGWLPLERCIEDGMSNLLGDESGGRCWRVNTGRVPTLPTIFGIGWQPDQPHCSLSPRLAWSHMSTISGRTSVGCYKRDDLSVTSKETSSEWQ